MLPLPSTFYDYDEETRERICRWNDSFTIDESRRQDKLVENEIKQQDRASWMTFALMVLFSAMAFIGFIVTGNANAFWILSVPSRT